MTKNSLEKCKIFEIPKVAQFYFLANLFISKASLLNSS